MQRIGVHIYMYTFLYMLASIASVFASTSNLSQEEIGTQFIGKISVEGNSLVDLLANEQPKERERRSIILHYCDVVLGAKKDKNLAVSSFSYANMRYDAKMSLFVYGLCVNMDKVKGHKPYKPIFTSYKDLDLSTYLKASMDDLNTLRGIPLQSELDSKSAYHPCDPKTSMMQCNFSRFTPDIFRTIMNDYSNIKLSTIYGVKYGQKPEDRQQAIRDYAITYFHDPDHPGETCNTSDTDTSIFYLNEKPLKETSKQHCSHPKTYHYLDQLLSSAYTLTKKTIWVESTEILTAPCKDYQGNMIACAFSSKGKYFVEDNRSAYQNVILNEMMRYNLFLSYYKGSIDQYMQYKELNFRGVNQVNEEENLEGITIENEQSITQYAIQQNMRFLSQLSTTLPIHIGLLAYYEDLIYVRKSFVSLYTPLHQLYYKFRNAQECK